MFTLPDHLPPDLVDRLATDRRPAVLSRDPLVIVEYEVSASNFATLSLTQVITDALGNGRSLSLGEHTWDLDYADQPIIDDVIVGGLYRDLTQSLRYRGRW